MDLYTLTADGVPVRAADWSSWAASDFTVARTVVGPGYVSTIFLGWRHPGGRREDPPLLFETMTFGIDGLEGEEERYATRAEALAGHARAVAKAGRAVAEAAEEAPLRV